jgi:hypothetical protein
MNFEEMEARMADKACQRPGRTTNTRLAEQQCIKTVSQSQPDESDTKQFFTLSRSHGVH